MDRPSEHWNTVHNDRSEAALTWYEEQPSLSHELVMKYSRPGDAIIDMGGGASKLVDSLAGDGYGPLTVLDVSEAALQTSKDRLGERADIVTWIAADITKWTPGRTFALWHDRAVFHFLTDERDRAAYVSAMDTALVPGGKAIMATFAEDGPEMCSGLPVVRYSSEGLAQTLDSLAPGQFQIIEARQHTHVTPKANRQRFQVSVFTK